MFKLVVLFSVLALAAAKPGGWVAPLAYSSVGVVPAVSSVSQYSSGIYHGTPIAHSVYSGYSPVVTGYSVVPGVTTYSQVHHSPAVVHTITKRAVPGPIAKRSSVPGPINKPSSVPGPINKPSSVPGPINKRSVPGPIAYTSAFSPVVPVSPVVSSAYSPIAYSNPSVTTYNAPGYAYSALIGPPGPVWSGKALSVHPW